MLRLAVGPDPLAIACGRQGLLPPMQVAVESRFANCPEIAWSGALTGLRGCHVRYPDRCVSARETAR